MPVRYSKESAGPSTRRADVPCDLEDAGLDLIYDGDTAVGFLIPDGGLEAMTKSQLQEALAGAGLPTSGTKAELIERLGG